MDHLGRRRPALDVLRAVAALGVVFGHAGMLANAAHSAPPGVIGFVAQNGWKGIYLFFAISGYLIARPFVRAAVGVGPSVDLAGYARRRAARILPAHWIALTAMALLIMVDAGAIPQDLTPGRYLAHMLLVQNLVPGVALTILPVTWTLGIEAIFYVSVPAVFRLVTSGGRRRLTERRLLQALIVVWVAAGTVMLLDQSISSHTPAWWSVALDNVLAPTLGYLFFFIPGIALAVLEARVDRGLPSLLMSWGQRAPVQLIALAVAMWVAAGELSHVVSGVALSAGALTCDAALGGAAVLAAVTGLRSVRLPRAAIMLGEASYGIYLWHWIVANLLLWASHATGMTGRLWGNQALDWLVLAALTFPLAWGSWVWIERPAMLWARRREAATSPTRAELATVS